MNSTSASPAGSKSRQMTISSRAPAAAVRMRAPDASRSTTHGAGADPASRRRMEVRSCGGIICHNYERSAEKVLPRQPIFLAIWRLLLGGPVATIAAGVAAAGHEPDADTGLRPEVTRLGGGRLQLAADGRHVGPQVVRLPFVRRPPHLLQELALRDEAVPVAGHDPDELPLRGGQAYAPALPPPPPLPPHAPDH